MPGVVSPSITQTANGVNLYQPANSGNTDVVVNLQVTGNATVGGTLAVTGATTLSSVSASSVASSGVVSAGSISTAGGVTAGTLSSSGGVNGATVTASGAVSAGSVSSTGNIVSTAGGVSAQSFTNTSLNAQTIQIVSAGVPLSGVTVGSTGTGNNLLAINMQTLFPSINSFKQYKIFLSGSSSDRFSGMTMGYSGGGSGGAFITQWSSVSGFALYTGNYKGNVSTVGLDAPAGSGGTLAVYPDNVVVTGADLTSSTIYYGGTLTNGATGGFNVTGTNVWLHLFPIL
jgi:hypothetical protein